MKAFFILVLALSLYASDGKKEHHLSKDLSYLELSVEQKEATKILIKQFRVDIKAFREFKEQIEKEKEGLIMNDVLSEEALTQLNLAMTQKASAIESRFLMQMHTLLTPEQRKKFARTLEEWEVE